MVNGILPDDDEVSGWYTMWIGKGCSASTAIYKFRNWLKDRDKKIKTNTMLIFQVDTNPDTGEEKVKPIANFDSDYKDYAEKVVEFLNKLDDGGDASRSWRLEKCQP